MPNNRSNIRNTSATVMTGNAVTMMNCVTNVIHVNTGIRMRRMPGARRFTIVTMKLIPAAMEAIPSTCRPITQKSTCRPGEYWADVRLA